MNLLDQVESLSREAGALALSHYGRAAVEHKADASPVSAADREVEAFLRRRLARLDEDALFVGEESSSDATLVEAARAGERVWVVDPIDGTSAFLGQLDTFAVCVGLLRLGRPHLGVVHLPALDQTYLAARGEGARWRTPRGTFELPHQQARTRPVACLLAPSNAHRDYRVTYPGKIRSLGSTAYHCVLVARGLGVGAFSRSHIWDWAAAAAIVEEAGAVMRRLDREAVDWTGLLDGRREEVPVLAAWPRDWETVAGQVALR